MGSVGVAAAAKPPVLSEDSTAAMPVAPVGGVGGPEARSAPPARDNTARLGADLPNTQGTSSVNSFHSEARYWVTASAAAWCGITTTPIKHSDM